MKNVSIFGFVAISYFPHIFCFVPFILVSLVNLLCRRPIKPNLVFQKRFKLAEFLKNSTVHRIDTGILRQFKRCRHRYAEIALKRYSILETRMKRLKP